MGSSCLWIKGRFQVNPTSVGNVDPSCCRATLILGFLPQELLGTSMYEYYYHEDIHAIAECHKCALQNSERVTTKIYRFRTKDGGFVRLQSEWKSFKNPWTKDIEYLIAKNSLILYELLPQSTNFLLKNSRFRTDFRTVESSAARPDGLQENFDFFTQSKSPVFLFSFATLNLHLVKQMVKKCNG